VRLFLDALDVHDHGAVEAAGEQGASERGRVTAGLQADAVCGTEVAVRMEPEI